MYSSIYYRKGKKPKPVKPRVILGILLLMFFYLNFSGPKVQDDGAAHFADACDVGPLNIIEECRTDHSKKGDAGNWWYRYAAGKLSNAACNTLSMNEQEFRVSPKKDAVEEVLEKADCRIFDLNSQKYFCYASQYWDEKLSHRMVNIMVAEGDCGRAFYFHAANTILSKGQPTPVADGRQPFAMLPDITAKRGQPEDKKHEQQDKPKQQDKLKQ